MAERVGDEVLLAGYAQGDERAFGQLMDRHRQALFGYLHRLTGDCATAEDLLQETFLRVVDNLWRFVPGKSFRTWLYAIATNLARNELRRRKRRAWESARDLDEENPGIGTEDPLAKMVREENAARLAQCLGSLNGIHRTVFVLRLCEGLSYDEIAEIVKCKPETARTRMFHALEKLKNAMGDI